MKTYFKQPCPVCGRPLYVPIELLGRAASCSHCSGVFTANGSDDESLSGGKSQTGKAFGSDGRWPVAVIEPQSSTEEGLLA
jgi:hypothetical protein